MVNSHQASDWSSRTVFLLAFTSGFIIMSIELLGGRVLAPYFGSSIYVWGSIITVFMVSLSIGYLTGGHLSLRSPGLNRYSLFFLIAAVAIILGLSASFALSLPVSTPPNAIAYSTGLVAGRDFRAGGLRVGVLGPLLVIA